MNTKLALLILSVINSGKRVGWPFNINEIWYQVFPEEKFPSHSIHSEVMPGDTLDHEKAKARLLEASIDYISHKLDKNN